MHVGILGGTGPLGTGLALRLAASGETVTVGSRQAERAHEIVAALRERWPARHLELRGASNVDAGASDLVVVATPWEVAVPTVTELADELAGKVVVSVANALVKQGREMQALFPARGSMAAAVQAALPRSFVAGAGHHLPASSLADLDEELEADVLVCSDHPRAMDETSQLLSRIPGIRTLEAGSMSCSSAVEAFTAVLVTLNIRYRAHSTLRLGGLDHVG